MSRSSITGPHTICSGWGRAGIVGAALAGLFLAAAPRASAQMGLGIPGPYGAAWGPTGTYNYYGGVGPYGWGAYGYGVTGYGVGPNTPSMTVANQAQIRLAQDMMDSARYDVRTAEAMQASMAVNQFRRQAMDSVNRIRRSSSAPVVDKFDLARKAPAGAGTSVDLSDPTALGKQVERILDPTGQILWPVPLDDLSTRAVLLTRQALETAVASTYESWVADHRAPLNSVVRARLALKSHAQIVLDALDDQGDTIRSERLAERFRELDSALQAMATTPPPSN